MDNPVPVLRMVLLAVLLAPLGAAAAAAVAGSGGRNPRRFALLFALAHLGLTAFLVVPAAVELTQRSDPSQGGRPETGFRPIFVPGDAGFAGAADSQLHETRWVVLAIGSGGHGVGAAEIQFYLGLDGLNVWLVALTSLMTLVAVLVSWDGVRDRAGGFYAWLFALQSMITGAFLAFDLVLFYVFFELTLIPAFFLIGAWGVGGNRRDAARKFFLYTLAGSLLTLVGAVGVVLTNPTPLNPTSPQGLEIQTLIPDAAGEFAAPKRGPLTFSVPRLMRHVSLWSNARQVRARQAEDKLSAAAVAARAAEDRSAAAPADAILKRAADDAREVLGRADAARAGAAADRDQYRRLQTWLFVALMAGFAVKIPVVPFHTWQPAAYSEAPTGVTALLSAVLSKLGTFGVIRIVLPLCPDAALEYGLPVFGTLGAVGIVYAALCAFAQRDIKLLTAYSSISHLGFVVIGLFAFNREGLTGAALHMVNHGLATGAMFALLAFLVDRYRTLDANQYGGLWARFPGYTVLMFVVCLAGIGLPGLNNFVSEMLMLAGVFDPANTRSAGYGLGVAAAVGILLSAWYVLTMLRRVFFGPLREQPPAAAGVPKDVSAREVVAFGLPAVLCLALGLYPQPVIDAMTADVGVVAAFGAQARERAADRDR